MGPVRVIMIQRNEALSSQLADFLTAIGMTVDGDVCDLLELKTKSRTFQPHIALLDVRYADNGFSSFCRSLREALPRVKFVLMGPEPEAYYARHAATLGADLYLSEALPPSEWLRRLRALVPKDKMSSEKCPSN